jgi:predicted negative regulator of RcsB-dependent stress response
MEQFATEEQQVEAIKKFWKDNGSAIIIGAVLGLGALWGWRYYTDTQIMTKETASTEYQTLVTSLSEDAALDKATAFITAQGETGYAPLAGFIAAQAAVEKADFPAAISQLQNITTLTNDAVLLNVANLRLARVQFATEDYTSALTSLNNVTNEAFIADKEALRGDILVAQCDFAQAQSAYTASLAANDDRSVQIRLDNIGAMIDAAADATGN